MPAFAEGQALKRTTLAVETTAKDSLEEVLKSAPGGRTVVAPAERVHWHARASDYSGTIGSAEAEQMPRWRPESWWRSRIRAPELSITVLDRAAYVGDSIVVTREGNLFEHSFPRYNRVPTAGDVISQSPDGYHFAQDVRVDRSIEGLSFVIGDLPGQFGHFLLEVFSRVWALTLIREQFPELRPKVVLFAKELRPWQKEFLELADWARQEILMLSEPAEFEAAIIASPAYVLHYAVSLRVAPAYAELGKAAVAQESERDRSRKIYLSRSRWPKLRRLNEEEQVESLFAERGFEVIHPQALSIREQVAMARSAKALCGPIGSAMYLAAFQQAGAENFVIAPSDFALPDDRMLGHLTGGNVSYYFGSGDRVGAERAADWRVDLDGLARALDRWLADTSLMSAGRAL